MGHLSMAAWRSVGGDILVPLVYLSGPMLMMLSMSMYTARQLKAPRAASDDETSATFCFGMIMTIIAHLISAGVIK